MNSTDQTYKDFARLPAFGGFVLRGDYGELAQFINEVKHSCPSGIEFIFEKFSPGRIWLKAEGSD